MAAQVKMVVVDGVRYRPESAPERRASAPVTNKARKPDEQAEQVEPVKGKK